MKNLKTAVWAAFLILCNTALGGCIRVMGVVPDMLLAFCVCAVLCERSFSRAVVTAAICGAAAGALGGSMWYTALMYTWTGLAVFALSEKLLRPRAVIAAPVCAAATFVIQLVYFALHYSELGTFGLRANLCGVILPEMIYNAVIALVIFAPVKYTVYYEKTIKVKI